MYTLIMVFRQQIALASNLSSLEIVYVVIVTVFSVVVTFFEQNELQQVCYSLGCCLGCMKFIQ